MKLIKQDKKNLASHAHLYIGAYFYDAKADATSQLSVYNMEQLLNSQHCYLVLRTIDDIKEHEFASLKARAPLYMITPSQVLKYEAQKIKYLCLRGIDLFDFIKENTAISIYQLPTHIQNPYATTAKSKA